MPGFQSTLPARGATLLHKKRAVLQGISIHAPRTGSDRKIKPPGCVSADFNPRSPHGERHDTTFFGVCPTSFQSTLPARGATAAASRMAPAATDFNPRSPHGERRARTRPSRTFTAFQSTLPARGATSFRHAGVWYIPISIHAPRTGSDQHSQHATLKITRFQSTLPARGATVHVVDFSLDIGISIHAPRTGSDAMDYVEYLTAKAISIHAPRTGSDSRLSEHHSDT